MQRINSTKNLILTIFFSISLAPLWAYAHACKPVRVVFDLSGVLITVNRRAVLAQLGIGALGTYVITTGNKPHVLKHKLYKILHILDPSPAVEGVCDDEANPLPSLFCDWLRGDKAGNILLKQVTNAIYTHPEWFTNRIEQTLVGRLATALFTPEQFAQSCQLSSGAAGLINVCKANGWSIYIISNFDAASFNLIAQRYASFFSQFDGIIISGYVHALKPSAEIYRMLPAFDGITLFVDDQTENLQAAYATCGFIPIMCPQHTHFWGLIKKPDLDSVRAALAAYTTPFEISN